MAILGSKDEIFKHIELGTKPHGSLGNMWSSRETLELIFFFFWLEPSVRENTLIAQKESLYWCDRLQGSNLMNACLRT